VPSRILVLISGSGTNLQALLESLPSSGIPADVVAVGSDRQAGRLSACDPSGASPPLWWAWERGADREAWGLELSMEMEKFAPDVIVLSGFMKILPPSLVAKFQPRIINTHPSFLPDFPGAHAVKDALAAHVTATGASVIVVDDGVDTGAILAQGRVPVLPGDTEESLHARIKGLERQLLLDVLVELIPAT